MFGFKSMVSKFAFWSVVLLILSGVTLYKAAWNNQNASTQPFTYWRGEYRDIAAALAPDATVRQAALDTNASEVQQVTVLEFPLLKIDGTSQQRVDRCQSCHAGLLDPNMTAEKIIKFRDKVTIPTEQVGAYRRVGVRIALTASWPVLVRLLQAAAEATPGLLVNDLQIRGSRLLVRPTEVPLDALMTVSAFRAGVAPAAGAPAEPQGGAPR